MVFFTFSFKDPKLVHSQSFAMNRRQIYKGSSFYDGWMRRMLVYDDSLSPLELTSFGQ